MHGASPTNELRPGPGDRSWSRGLEGMPIFAGSTGDVLLASLAINVLSLGLPLVILQVYDRILPNAATDTLLLLILGLLAVLLLDGLFRAARAYLTGWNAARLEHAAGCRAVDRLLGTDIRSFEREAPGVYLDRLYAIDQLREYHAGQAKLVMVDLPFVAVFLGLIWFIGGALVLIPLGLLAVLAAVGSYLGFLIRAAIRDRVTLDNRRYSFIIEVLSRIETVKMLAMEPLLQRRYERLQESGAVGTYRTSFLGNLTQSLGALFSNLVMVSVAAAGAVEVIAGELSIGGLAASTLLAGRAVQPLLRGLGIWTQVQNVAVAREQLGELFALPPESTGNRDAFDDIRGGVELKGVSFGYDPESPLLADANLSVAPGETIGISGDTGCGKTTLLMLRSGLIKPDAGQVLFDGIDAAEADPHSLRSQIAFLPQNAAIFRGTILENLTMFEDGERTEEALDIARSIGLHEAVHRLPAGYRTQIGDGATDQLPSGIRQAIAMVRALSGGSRVILFDEANSAFDAGADALLKEALRALKGKATMVLVSHRPSILALADRRYHLIDGKLEPREEAAPAAGAAPGEDQPDARRSAS